MEVKICGMTNRDDVLVALEAGADYIGFVLYPDSPRGISASKLVRILDTVSEPCRAIAVCVNMPRTEIERLTADCDLWAVQLHGDEDAREFRGMQTRLWRAVRLVGGSPEPAIDEWPVDRFLVDAAVPGAYGGTGETADWQQAAAFAARQPTMLAGGLTALNVEAAIQAVHPLGVDVASGVEAVPGRKDSDKVRTFIRHAKRPLTPDSEAE